MLLHSLVLMLTLTAATTDEAMGFAGMFYLFWWQVCALLTYQAPAYSTDMLTISSGGWQFRGWFVAPSAYNPAIRWVIELNPSHYIFQVSHL